jgi:hypothetical protein
MAGYDIGVSLASSPSAAASNSSPFYFTGGGGSSGGGKSKPESYLTLAVVVGGLALAGLALFFLLRR